jgi:hypothetical protein
MNFMRFRLEARQDGYYLPRKRAADRGATAALGRTQSVELLRVVVLASARRRAPNALFRIPERRSPADFEPPVANMLNSAPRSLLDEIVAALAEQYTAVGLNIPGSHSSPSVCRAAGSTATFTVFYGRAGGHAYPPQHRLRRTDSHVPVAVGQP